MMTALARPLRRPQNPFFSVGPCAKHPGWSLDNLKDAKLGRSHRSSDLELLLPWLDWAFATLRSDS
jgi:hypothetical protein